MSHGPCVDDPLVAHFCIIGPHVLLFTLFWREHSLSTTLRFVGHSRRHGGLWIWTERLVSNNTRSRENAAAPSRTPLPDGRRDLRRPRGHENSSPHTLPTAPGKYTARMPHPLQGMTPNDMYGHSTRNHRGTRQHVRADKHQLTTMPLAAPGEPLT